MGSEAEDRSVREILKLGKAEFYALYSAEDLALTKRVGGILWLAGLLVAVLLLPLAPPDQSSLGDAGWPIAVGVVAVGAVGAARLFFRPEAVSPNQLLGFSYVTLALIGALMWLSDEPTPYAELMLLATLYAAGIHPPRRVAAFLVAVAVALATPLLYTESALAIAELFASVVIWGGLAMGGSVVITRMRIQRAGLRRAGDRAWSQARVDPLTGLGNRRAFDEALLAAFERVRRNGEPLSVILADVDSFKELNDRYGLPVGDRYLREVAAVLEDTARGPDACFRWGGDEFVIIADVDRDGARQLGERLVRAVAARCLRPDGLPVHLHVGCAQLGIDGSGAEELVAAASRTLKPAAGDLETPA